MLFLVFERGADRYALDTARIVEVLPLVAIKQTPQAPPAVAGVFDYRGAAVPLIDLSRLALDRPARQCLSTRIVVVEHTDAGLTRLLGLIAEGATTTLRRAAEEFDAAGIDNPGAPYLGPVTRDARGLVQRIEVDQLLTEPLRRLLYRTETPG